MRNIGERWGFEPFFTKSVPITRLHV